MEEKSEKDLYGNIDETTPVNTSTGASNKLMALTVSNIQIREWIQVRRDGIQPWSEFLNTKKFKAPKSLAPVGQRLLKNVDRFQSNYLFVFLGLLVFCILTSPILLIVIAACLGACYIINLKNTDGKIAVLGRDVSVAQQYAAVGAMSFPLFWIAGAGSAVFWVIGASIFVIVLHASMYSIEDEADLFAIPSETV